MNSEFINTNPKLLYLNTFAAVFENSVLIHHYNPKTPIHISNIKKVFLTKRKKVKINWLFFIISGLGGIALALNYFKSYLFILILITLSSLVIAVVIKTYSYSFVIILMNGEIVRIKLDKKNLSDAKQILKQTQKSIENNKKNQL